MSEEFVITDERLNTIAKDFKIDKNSVELLYNEFCKLEPKIKEQHVAHLSRVLEFYVRKIIGNPGFFIEYVPCKVRTPQMRGAMSTIFRRSFQKFTVYYDDRLPQRDIRVNISHELGHLYLNARYYGSTITSSSVLDENKDKYEETTEPLSSIFGLFVVSNKNHHYENLDVTGQKHPNWKSILEAYKNL